jgi:hypothetical protein
MMSDNVKATSVAALASAQQALMIAAMRQEGERRNAAYYANLDARRLEDPAPKFRCTLWAF